MQKILRQLLAFNTQNSSRVAGGHTLPLLLYLKDRLEKKGARVVLQKYSVQTSLNGKPALLKDRGNLLAVIGKKKPAILFQGHVDTVPDPSQFSPKVTHDFAVGRGAVDMKGPVAGLIGAFETLLEKREELTLSPALLLTSDEEAHNFSGIKKFLKEHLLSLSDIKFGICAEPTNMKIKMHLYGAMYFLLRTYGTQLHSAVTCGDNAIEKAIPILSSLVELKKKLAEGSRDGFGASILNIGIIRGGEIPNQTPKTCEIHFTIRNTKPVNTIENLLRKKVFLNLPEGAKVEKLFAYDPIVVKLQPLYKTLIKKAFFQSRLPLEFGSMKGFSEATFLNNAGLPCFVFGPGKFELAHAPARKEKIKIAQIKKYVNILVKLCTP